MTPRTKGFTASIPHLRGKVDAIYDIQLGFNPKATVKPTMTNLLRGEKVEAHLYIKRIPISEIPEDAEAASTWLHQKYYEKVNQSQSKYILIIH